jgi:putative DNA methylase
MSTRKRITRGNLPHWYVPGAAHFVTYRIAGTLPEEVLQALKARKEWLLQQPLPEGVPSRQRVRVHKKLFAEYDDYLGRHGQVDWLRRPAIAAMIRQNLYFHNHLKYHLLAYCIMPNHVHVLLQPIPDPPVDEAALLRQDAGRSKAASSTGEEPCGEQPDASSPLSSIMHSLKSYTANQANALLRRKGQFWQHESYDHWIRDEDELERVVDYIAANPLKAGLARYAHEWYFCSAHDRFLHDGGLSAWIADLRAP